MNRLFNSQISLFYLLFVFMFINSCIVKHNAFYVDNGKKGHVRYSMIEDKDFELLVDVEDSIIDISFFTSENVNFVKDRGINIKIQEIRMVLKNTNDTLMLKNKNELTYSCPIFIEKIKKNRQMHLEFEYIIDSMGFEKRQLKKYDLIKKQDRHLSFRVH